MLEGINNSFCPAGYTELIENKKQIIPDRMFVSNLQNSPFSSVAAKSATRVDVTKLIFRKQTA